MWSHYFYSKASLLVTSWKILSEVFLSRVLSHLVRQETG